jgi:hypothetical protein
METAVKLNYLQVFIQEPEAHGVNRVVTVMLSAEDGNEIRVQGISETWVGGKTGTIAAVLKPKEAKFATWVRKFGIYIIYLAMLVALPGFASLTTRIGIAFGVVVVVIAYAQILKRVIPNTLIDLSPPPTRIWTPFMSQLFAAFIALALGVAASYIFDQLAAVFPDLLRK